MVIVVNRWRIEVSPPHPCWVKFEFNGDSDIRHVTHKDLRDLEYGVKRAIQEAKVMLPDSCKHEVE